MGEITFSKNCLRLGCNKPYPHEGPCSPICARTSPDGLLCVRSKDHEPADEHSWGKYPTPAEAVDHPSHYGGKDDPHEHVKCAEAVGLDQDAMLYNCTKYIWRFGKKGTPEDFLKDLKKARWYLDRRIARLEAEGK